MKKIMILPIALIGLAALPARAHHEHAYGLFWKPGASLPADKPLPADLWKYAFVSKFNW